MFITRKELQNYRNCSHNTATKEYKKYLIKADKDEDQSLTLLDLSRIDNLPVEIVKQRCKM